VEIGEEITTPVKLLDFGRRAVLAVRQNLVSRILDLEKENIHKKYTDKTLRCVSVFLTGFKRKSFFI